jgi:hypothetical protein
MITYLGLVVTRDDIVARRRECISHCRCIVTKVTDIWRLANDGLMQRFQILTWPDPPRLNDLREQAIDRVLCAGGLYDPAGRFVELTA